MADQVGEAIVALRADISDLKKGFADAIRETTGFGAKSVAQGALVAGGIEQIARKVVSFSQDSVKAYGQQQVELARLTKLVGVDVTNAYRDMADQLSRATGYDNDSILSLQAQLAGYGILPGSIEKATHAAIEFAAQTGQSLPAAGAVLGQALAGQSRELRAYGLQLSLSATRSQNLEKATNFLLGRFHDTAEQIHGGVLGSYQDFDNAVSNLKQSLGQLLDGEAKKMLSFFTSIVEDGTRAFDAMNDFNAGTVALGTTIKRVLMDVLKATVDFFLFYVDHMPVVGSTLKLIGINADDLRAKADALFDKWSKGIDATIPKLNEHKKAATAAGLGATGAIEHEIAAIQQLNDEIERQAQIQAHITEITKLETKKRIDTARNAYDANASFSQALSVRIAEDTKSWGTVMAEVTMNMAQTFSSSIADMIVNGGKFKDTMKAIGKQILQDFITQVLEKMVVAAVSSTATISGLFASIGFGGGAAGGAAGAAAGGAGGFGAIGIGAGGVGLGLAVDQMLKGMGANDLLRFGLDPMGYQFTQIKNLITNPTKTISNAANSVSKTVKKLFSGGVVSEPTLMIGTRSGQLGVTGESGPEALMSFKDMGLTPESGRNRLLGRSGGGGGGGGDIHIHVAGTFIEGNEAKWQKLVHTVIAPEVRRFMDSRRSGPFTRQRGAKR